MAVFYSVGHPSFSPAWHFKTHITLHGLVFDHHPSKTLSWKYVKKQVMVLVIPNRSALMKHPDTRDPYSTELWIYLVGDN